MTDLIQTAREIVHACLVREFLDPKRVRSASPIELDTDVETYCQTFGISSPTC
jgi:hypothetical protein